MVRPMQTTILQGVGNVSFDLGWEIFYFCISEPGIFKLADVETELRDHRLEASNPQLHVCLSDVHPIVAAITNKEIINRQMPGTNPSIGRFISIEQRVEGIHPPLNKIGLHSCQLCNCLITQCTVQCGCKKHSNHTLKLGAIVHYLCFEDTGVKFE